MKNIIFLTLLVLIVLCSPVLCGNNNNSKAAQQAAAQATAQQQAQAAAAAAAAAQAQAQAQAQAAAQAAAEAAAAANSGVVSLSLFGPGATPLTDPGTGKGITFDPATKAYTLNVAAEITQVSFQGSTAVPGATLSVSLSNTNAGAVTIPNTGLTNSSPLNLVAGTNNALVTSTSADGTSTNTYTFAITQLPSTVTTLSAFVLTTMNGLPLQLIPPFNPSVQSYKVIVPANATGVVIAACTKSPSANMFIQMNQMGTPLSINDNNNKTALPISMSQSAAFVSLNVQAQNPNVISQTTLTIARANSALANEFETSDASSSLLLLNAKLQQSQTQNQYSTDSNTNTQNTNNNSHSYSTLLLAGIIAGSIVGGFIVGVFLLYLIKAKIANKTISVTNSNNPPPLATGNLPPVTGTIKTIS